MARAAQRSTSPKKPAENGRTSSPSHRRSLLHLIPRHGAFPVAAVAGVVAFIVSQFLWPDIAIGISANVWFLVYLGVVFSQLPRQTPELLKRHADEQAPPIGVIMLVTLGVVAISAYSLFAALNSGGRPRIDEVVLGLISVLLGWGVVHTMAGLHYAYEFYEAPDDGKGGKEKNNISGGLEWPKGGEPPDGSAFLYLACQMGAALQVSDTPVTTNKMRRLVLAHTVFSFFYNTMLVAAAVNVVIKAAGG